MNRKEEFIEIGVDNKFVISGKWHCFLRIGNQTFYLTATETKKESTWVFKQLKYAIDQLITSVKDNWISVEDELPTSEDDKKAVNGYSKDWIDLDFNPRGIRECFIGGEGKWFSSKWSNDSDCWITIEGETPTHWQPLPQPPKE